MPAEGEYGMSESTKVQGTKSAQFGAMKIVFGAMGIALAMVTSYVKLFEMPMGGSVTLLSMLFIVLIGYWYGPKLGISVAIAYGVLQFVLDPYVVSVPQVLVDYPLAFGALGLAGVFHNRKHGLYIGYIVAVLGRYFFAFLSGYIFFGMYAPEEWNPVFYSLAYNGAYLGAEAVLTLIIIALPPMKSAIDKVKSMTT